MVKLRICGATGCRRSWRCGLSDRLPGRPAVRYLEHADHQLSSLSRSLPASEPAKRYALMRPGSADLPHPRRLARARLGPRLPHASTRHGGRVGERDDRAPARSAASGGGRHCRLRFDRFHAAAWSHVVAKRPPLHLGLSNYRVSARPFGSIQGHSCVPPCCSSPGWVLHGRPLPLRWQLPLTNDRPRMLPLRELQSSAERTPTPRTRYGTLSYRQSFVGNDASSTCENIVKPLTGTSATWIVPVSASVM